MTPSPPGSVVKDLYNYDPRLRLRWGPATQLWYLERKLDARHPAIEKERPNPLGTSPRCRDLWEGYRDGYAAVMAIHPTLCNSRAILATLSHSDIHAHGGAKALNRRLDEIQEEEERAADRALDTFVEAGSREIYDRDQVLGKRKVYGLNEEARPEPSRPPEQRDGFVVVDRRVTV